MKKILGLDLGTNSIGWALVEQDFDKKEGKIIDAGSRIIPMDQSQLTDFERGNSVSATANRTGYRGVRRLYERDNLRRERLHRVLNILGFLPEHYAEKVDFDKKKGQFTEEVKLNYRKGSVGYEFIFKDSFQEMIDEFKAKGIDRMPYDWTLYYLRKKALQHKISKEELAWVILNFNQKRGYYQLRGEEEEIDNNKIKSYEILQVDKLVDTGETIKGKEDKLYEIYFTNGWKYDKMTTKPELWEGKTKEFIVTTSKTKDENIKRTFKAVDSEKDWIAIKAKIEQELKAYIGDNDKSRTVGTFIYEKLLENPTQKIRGKLIKTIERKFYKQELEAILTAQIQFHPELQDKNLFKACVEELYPRNEAHQKALMLRKESFKHLFVDDIIFYQRPLKSQKSNIGGCQYEKRPARDKDGNPVLIPLKVTSKSNPVFQEFRLWQWLHNLKIYANDKEVDGIIKSDVDVTQELLPAEDDRVELFEYLTTKKEIDLAGFLKYFSQKGLIDKQKKDNFTHRWNYSEDKKYPLYETRNGILSRLKKVEGLHNPNVFLTPEIEKHLWHIIYSITDAEEFKKALGSFAGRYGLDKESFVQNFNKIPPYKSDYASYSEKAIKKLLSLMRMGKYWDESKVSKETTDRIQAIMQRVEALHLSANTDRKQIAEAFEKYQVTDDDIPKQMVKSFIPFIDRNPLKGLNTYQAGYAIYGRHSESGDIQYWKTPADIDHFLYNFKQHSLRNPIVEQIVLETLRTVRDIWNYYGEGKNNFFDEIHLELGRDMKNPAEKRKKMSQRNVENERTNQRIRALLNELTNEGAKSFSPSHQEILKIYEEDVINSNEIPEDIEKIRKNNKPSQKDIERYKLWLEQKYISPYTGKPILLSDLFSEKYQIEHIIPQSRYFDNSMSNKVICESAVNEQKSNQTAYEFIKHKGGTKVELGDGTNVNIFTFDKYQAHCNMYFKKNRQKFKNLLAEEIPEGFINRQMNDSRYISKLIKSLLSNIVREDGEQEPTTKRLLPVTGAITSKLKQDWGLNDKWNGIILPRFQRLNKLIKTEEFTYINEQGVEVPTVPDTLRSGFNKKRIDHRHHALDALVIATCTRKHIQYINSLNNKNEKYDLQPALMIKNEQGDFTKYFRLPWSSFPVDVKNVLENTIISFKKNTRVLTKTNNKYWNYVKQKDGSYKKELVRQKGDNRAIRKPLHKETVFGKLKWEAGKGKIYAAVRTDLSAIKNRKHWKKITDSGIKKILDNHLKKYTDEKGIEDFEQAFSPEGIEDLNKNIKTLNNGKHHHAIYKVRMFEESSKFPVSDNLKTPKHKKYVEAAKGTNLFFNIYVNEEGKREFETVPLNEVIAHRKWRASLPKEEQKNISLVPVKNIIKNRKVTHLFTLSPNDLVYVPTDEEIVNLNDINFTHLAEEQKKRIYKIVSFTGKRLYAIPYYVATSIYNKFEFTSLNKLELIKEKDRCIKLITNRIGKIIKIEK